MSPLPDSLRRGLLLLVAMFAVAAFSIRPVFAAPFDYTDNWYAGEAESGWGANFTQSDNFLFVTFFIYGPDKQPTWYTAELTWDGQSQFTGGLYRTTGTHFALPWNPADRMGAAVLVGTASFTPSTLNNYQGTLVYRVNSVGPAITKAITRLTLTTALLAANYVGGQSGTYSGCTQPAYQDVFTLQVTQTGASVSMKFTYLGGGTPPLTCTLAGTLIQNGSIARIPNATYQCSTGLNGNASVSDLRATPLGIEGQFTAANVGGGCTESARFSGTLN